MLRPNGSWGTCIPQGMLHSFIALHGAPFDFPIPARARRAERAAAGGILHAQRTLQGSPRAPSIHAQGVGPIVPLLYP